MTIIAKAAVGLVALVHVYFAYVEMFAWTARGPRMFDFPEQLFTDTVALAANQGLYNLFLVGGLVWAILIKDPAWARRIAMAVLGFVIIAGVFAFFTVTPKALTGQALPGALAFAVVWFKGATSKI